MDKKSFLLFCLGFLVSSFIHVKSEPWPAPSDDADASSTTPAASSTTAAASSTTAAASSTTPSPLSTSTASGSEVFWSYLNKAADVSKKLAGQAADAAATYAQKLKENAVEAVKKADEHTRVTFEKFKPLAQKDVDEVSKKYDIKFDSDVISGAKGMSDIMAMKHFPKMPPEAQKELALKFGESMKKANKS